VESDAKKNSLALNIVQEKQLKKTEGEIKNAA